MILWCTLTLLFHIILASMPKSSRRSGVSHTGDMPRLTTFGGVSRSISQGNFWKGSLDMLMFCNNSQLRISLQTVSSTILPFPRLFFARNVASGIEKNGNNMQQQGQSRKQVTSWRGELGKLVAWIFWILVVPWQNAHGDGHGI